MEQSNLFKNDSLYDEINQRFESLLNLSSQLESSSDITLATAMEADILVPEKGILTVYFGNANKVQKHQIASESIKASIVEAFKNAYEYIVKMLKQFIGWINELINRSFTGSKKQIAEIRQKYYSIISHIEDLEHKCVSIPPKGDHTHLSLFQKQPSVLFPHIERIWKSIKFERIGEDDRKLISNIDKIRKQYETDGKQIIGKLENRKQFWPAEDIVLRGAQRVNREMLKYIASLVHVGGFIVKSANTAYHATVKSFSYINRLLNAIGKLPNVDRDKLLKCIDVINQQRRRIDTITHIA